ncbi:hypothetical protein Pryu01_00655 [Paraliobacillus ryukyuensis]|uniref:Forespore regulator of the sigma-K checkpoint n=1 Tax=Paraliobacillus ryukyuensis TaxID=200904 RepID=A0A366EIJ4_9BACI|nr:intercompartmental signaling factor BofC [Paraliobacillus ryukyuensis]RBP01279.1 forespore regulator of the sigma-K checkpoint [Paraliobacillus ryukyuensis]
MKKYVYLSMFGVIMFLIGFSVHSLFEQQSSTAEQSDTIEVTEVSNTAAPFKSPLEIQVTLQKQYLDGKISEETHLETIQSMQDFWASYADWQVIDQKEGEMVFRKQMNDISPYIKKTGYFGLKDSMLSIFEGEPIHGQVIQSFYQIDTDTLESRKMDALQEGIKIESKDKYLQVLEVYRDLSPTKQVQG